VVFAEFEEFTEVDGELREEHRRVEVARIPEGSVDGKMFDIAFRPFDEPSVISFKVEGAGQIVLIRAFAPGLTTDGEEREEKVEEGDSSGARSARILERS
jgi:hypothetical protein